jgi:hypothetical protein
MSTKSALRADLGAEDRKTLAEDRKRMERLGKGSQLDDWLAFGPGLLIRRRLAKNIAGLAETDPAKGRRYSRAFKGQMEMDGLYDRTTKSDVMKSTFTAVLWFYDDERLDERRREILEEIRRNMTPGQRARFNSPISAQQRVLDELRTRGVAPAKKPRSPTPAKDLDQANARIVELEEELKSARSIAPVTDIADHAAEPTDPVVTTLDLQAYLEKRVNADGQSIRSTGSPSSADPAPSSSAEPPGPRCTDGNGNFEAFKSRWVQYCEPYFAALPAGMQTRFVTEVLRPMSPPSPPFSVQLRQ